MPGNFKAGSRTSVLLVEDEVMIRMMVADMLEELGYTIVAEAGDIDEAQARSVHRFDIAILDVNVNGKVITPVAEAVQVRGKPFVFADRLWRAGLAGKIPRPPYATKALPDRDAGAHDRDGAEGYRGLSRNAAAITSECLAAFPKTPRQCDRAAAA